MLQRHFYTAGFAGFVRLGGTSTSTHHYRRRQEKTLSGFDVYKHTHLLHHDDLHRNTGAVRLNVEAIKAFSDTVTISQRDAIAAEQTAVKQWLDKGGFEANHPYPWGVVSRVSIEYVNYEHLKIASAFELHLKARLLQTKRCSVSRVVSKPRKFERTFFQAL